MDTDKGSVVVRVPPCNQLGGLATDPHPVHEDTATADKEGDDIPRK